MSKMLQRGPRAAKGRDEVPVTRNEYEDLGKRFVGAHEYAEQATATKMQVILEAAEKTNNKDEAIVQFRDALKSAYLAKKCPAKSAGVYISDAIRVVHAYWQSVTVKKAADGLVSFQKGNGTTGKELFANMGYNQAIRTASIIRKLNGTGSKAGAKTKKSKASQPLDRGQIVDALDKVISAVRVTSGLDGSVLDFLVKAKLAIKGAPRVDRSAARLVGSAAETSPRLTKAEIAFASLSRGQKAAATRRANQMKQSRVVEQATVLH